MTDRHPEANLTADAYTDSVDHLCDELARLDRLLRYHLEVWWATRDAVDEYRGLYVSDERVDSLFPADLDGRRESTTNGEADAKPDPRLLDAVDTYATRIDTRRRQTLATGTELRLVRVAQLFDLCPAEVDVLLLTLAPDVDRGYETLYSYLHDDVTAKHPTVGLVSTVLAPIRGGEFAVRRLFARSGPLVSNDLLHVADRDGGSLLARRVSVDERIVDYLLEGDDLDAALDGIVDVRDTAAADRRPSSELGRWLGLDDVRQTKLDRLLGADRPTVESDGSGRGDRSDGQTAVEPPRMAYIWGPTNAGKRTVAEAFARAHDRALLVVDTTRVFDTPALVGETLARIRREGRLREATLCVRALDDLDEPKRTAVVRELDGFLGPVVLTGETAWRPRTPPASHVFTEIALSVPDADARRRLWRGALADTGVSVDEANVLASKFRLTPGAVRDAVETARHLTDSGPLTVDAVYEACRLQTGGSIGELAQAVPQPYTWNDIVLPADRLEQLREVAAHVSHRGTVYDDWGFAERYATGNGLVALFSGPSGTGKTMAASIVAREAGLDLYRIDLSSVVSKYIGETEKNLNRIFDEAAKGDAVLLFDEADALFGKRSEVKDAHDRYANVEVNYLLQRVETYDGVVILTTNFKRNIDEAFTRRIHLNVEFPLPDREARAAIWRRVFPDRTPVGELDIDFLAGLELTGGNIRSAALRAAFMAADADEDIAMRYVVRATKLELQKSGTLVDPGQFEAYRDMVT